MREYKLPEWKYSVETTKALSGKKIYSERFRHDYFVLLGTRKGLKSKCKTFLFSIVVYFNHLRHILVRQLVKTKNVSLDFKYNFFVENNPSYLRAVIPVAERLLQNGEGVIIICPANHYNRLKRSLKPELGNLLFVLEDAKIANSKFKAFGLIFTAVFKSVLDCFWFMSQPVLGRFFFATDYMKFGLSHYCYSNYWQKYFNEKKRYFLAANELQYSESLLFAACRDTISQSIILSHGRESEISYPIFAKKRFTWGKYDVDMIVNDFGANVSEIEALGSPYFDKIYYEIEAKKTHISGKMSEYIIFYCQPNYKARSLNTGEYDQVLSWFYSLSHKIPSKKFMLKLHPFDDLAYYKNAPQNIEVSRENILESLGKCFLMHTVDSNAMLEAAVFGIPVIQCIPSGSTISYDFSSSGISVRASTQEEFDKFCIRFCEDKDFYNEMIHKSKLALPEYFSNLGHSLDTSIF